MEKKIAVLPGDGIGPEVTEAAVKVLEVIARRFNHTFHFEYASIGGDAIDKHQNPLPDETIAICEASDAVLLGAVGGPKWDQNPQALRPEKGLLAIRKHFDLFANLRPVKAVPSLLHTSPLKEEIAKEVDMMIVRELTGGLYFGNRVIIQKNQQWIHLFIHAKKLNVLWKNHLNLLAYAEGKWHLSIKQMS